jgi:subtilisin family serine protease
MLGNTGKIDNIGAANKPWVNDLNAQSEQQNSFVNIDDTEQFEKLAKELNMSPKELRNSIDNGNIDPKKLIEALNKVSKVPGVSIDDVKLQKEVDKANLGKTLDTVANQTGFKNFDDLINALPENQTKGQSAQQVIEAVIDSGITANKPYSKLQAPNFEQALNRRLDKTGSRFNTAA